MLLCGHLLRRVHIPKFIPKFVPTIAHSFPKVTHVLPPLRSNSTAEPHRSVELLSGLPVDKVLDMLLRVPKPTSPSEPGSVGPSEKHLERSSEAINLAVIYDFLREKDRALVTNLPVSCYTRVIKHALLVNSSTCLDHLAADILEAYQGSNLTRTWIVQALIAHTIDNPLLSRDRVFSLLSQLESLGCLSLLPHNFLTRVTLFALLRSEMPILKLLTPCILDFVNKSPAPSGIHAMTYQPPEMARISSLLACKMLHGEQDLALDVFQTLVNTGNVPAEAIREVNALSRDFKFIIFSTIVRSCLHWNWKDTAMDLLIETIQSTTPLDESLVNLAMDTMYTVLDVPTIVDVSGCGVLMRLLLQLTDLTIPNGLVRLFYDMSHRLNFGEEAESVFSLIDSLPASETRHYPLPQGRALTWFMNYLTSNSRNIHLGRVLAKKVVEGCEPIPIQDRARFVATTAMHGYGTQARALWERYAVGEDSHTVVGNAATMLRMVSLFAYLSKRTKEKCRRLLPKLDVAPSNLDGEVNDLSYDSYQNRWKDFDAFTDRVITTFRQSKMPLSQASHFDLTSLSRAYFILGRPQAGFKTLRIVTDRKEVPDMHDINVALSGLAEHSPRDAAEVMERMVKKGCKIDPVTFGTVLHRTVRGGDPEQVEALMLSARKLGYLRTTPKTISSLIHDSLKIREGSQATIKANLQRALTIIRSPRRSSFIRIPNTGKMAIFTSLSVDDPIRAYKFWKYLVKDKTEWGDREQQFQRRLIARMIRKHAKIGWLDTQEANAMLLQLGEDTRL